MTAAAARAPRDDIAETPHSPAEQCPRPVDLVHLARYTLGNRALELEVLQLFAAQAPSLLERLRLAADERAWHEAAHALKGSARAIGAWPLGKAAEAAEAARTATDPAVRERAAARVELALHEALDYIRSLAE